MDDIILASNTVDELQKVLVTLLNILVKFSLEINFKKSSFIQKRIDYLGYDVSAQGILPNDTHLGAIKRYPEPLNSKALHSCLGLFSYFRKFVPWQRDAWQSP